MCELRSFRGLSHRLYLLRRAVPHAVHRWANLSEPRSSFISRRRSHLVQ
jgi:hypothetical protein